MKQKANNSVTFSIIIPFFNSEKYLVQTINSIVEQSYQDWELILVDDGSTDNSLSIVRNATESLTNRVKIYSTNNMGLSEARNFGIDRAKGEYILFVDSDDFLGEDLLVILHQYIVEKKFPDVLVFDYCEFLEGSGNFEKETKFDSQLNRYGEVVWNKAFKKSFFSKHDFKFNKNIHYEDTAIIHVIMAAASSSTKVNYIGYYYRRERPGSITSKKLDTEVVARMIALNQFENNIAKYTQRISLLGSKEIRMNFFLSLLWLHLFLDYQNFSREDDSYKKILHKLRSQKIKRGFVNFGSVKYIIIYKIVTVSVKFKMNFIIKIIDKIHT